MSTRGKPQMNAKWFPFLTNEKYLSRWPSNQQLNSIVKSKQHFFLNFRYL